MKTKQRIRASSDPLGSWLSRLFIGLASVVVILLDGTAEARPIEATVVPGLSIRNGDWIAVDGLGVILLGSHAPDRFSAVVLRGELGIGGASAGFGLATNLLSGPCPPVSGCDISHFLGSGMLSLEARVERMYGPTSWRSTTYVGGQFSLAAVIFKPSVGWMVDPRHPSENHIQVATGCGW